MNCRKIRFLISLGFLVCAHCIDENCVRPQINKDNNTDSSWVEALNTMSYHRSMMNEYLCRNYLAKEIVDTVRNQTIDKRLGKPAMNVRLVRESLLEDSGSARYKDWLSRYVLKTCSLIPWLMLIFLLQDLQLCKIFIGITKESPKETVQSLKGPIPLRLATARSLDMLFWGRKLSATDLATLDQVSPPPSPASGFSVGKRLNELFCRLRVPPLRTFGG